MRRFRASLSAFFAWAVRERLIVANPVTSTRVPKGRGVRTEIRPFAEDELESFYAAVRARDERLADILLIAGWTGLRWSELREVRVRDFVRVPMAVLLVSRAAPEGVEAKVTKSGKTRRVPVGDRVLPLVQDCAEQKGPGELLFTTRTGHQLHATAVKRSVAWSRGRPRPPDPRPAAHRSVPVAGQGCGSRDGSGLARARLDRHDEHLPAPPRLVRGPGRAGASERSGGRGGCAGPKGRRMTTRNPASRRGVSAGETGFRRGGAEGIRTPDLLIANETRYQLRHSPSAPDEPARAEKIPAGCGSRRIRIRRRAAARRLPRRRPPGRRRWPAAPARRPAACRPRSGPSSRCRAPTGRWCGRCGGPSAS